MALMTFLLKRYLNRNVDNILLYLDTLVHTIDLESNEDVFINEHKNRFLEYNKILIYSCDTKWEVTKRQTNRIIQSTILTCFQSSLLATTSKGIIHKK